MRATAPRALATHPAPAPTATSDGRNRRSPGANSNGSGPSLILATTRPVPGSTRTTSSVSRCTTQTVVASTASPVGSRPPAGNRAVTRLERGSIRTTSRSGHAPTQRLPAPKTSGTAAMANLQLRCHPAFGQAARCGSARIVAGAGPGRDTGASGLVMRPTTASNATAPTTAAPTRSLSRCDGMGSTSSVTSPQRHRLHGIHRQQGHRSRFAHPWSPPRLVVFRSISGRQRGGCSG